MDPPSWRESERRDERGRGLLWGIAYPPGRLKAEMGTFGNTNTTLVRHDYKRACYRAMLSEFSAEEVVEYFMELPLIMDGKVIKGPELFKLLWAEKGKIPLNWDSLTDNLIEPFFIKKGREVKQVLNKILWLNNKTTYIPGKVLLTWFYPKLESVFSSVDTRDMVFSLISLFTENYLPKHVHRRVKRWEEGDWVKSVQVFIADTEFNEFLDWDYDFIARPQIMIAPVMFGMPPFERFGMISDTRPPESVVWDKDAQAARVGDTLTLHGEVFGRRASFGKFCSDMEIDLSKFRPPDLETILVERDYFCPIRQRVVLYKGCAYGAPVFLNWVAHRKLNLQPKGIFSSLVDDIEREETLQDVELEKRHHALLAFVAGRASFVYHEVDESITLNGQYFTKNVPAKILKYLLESYLRQGKSEFEYRDLKRLFEISQGQKHSNFEVRFYRLTEKLKEECPTVSVDKTGRGRFAFVVTGSLEYSEV